MNLQQHLYDALLHATTPDITVKARSAYWSANYRLHRVVLVQAGFFNSLFTAGFAETTPQPEVTVVFDDTNITRAAFELCISRLYGGGPPLHISPSLKPSTAHPLTTATIDAFVPEGHHPATPRFLLSLLATSVYLSMPTLAAQALSSILSTVGPQTVLTYLDFALGKPISANLNEPDAAVGLENVAELLHDDAASLSGTSIYSIASDDPSRVFHYGAISDKIGEAAACWLTRWAPDMLALEERKAGVAWPAIWDRGGLSIDWICALAASDTLFVENERARYDFLRSVVELRRRRGLVQVEEDAFKRVFEDGIHYCNMTMEDVIYISKDSSPTTKQPFVSIAVLQASHWQSSILRQHITARPTSAPSEPRSPAAPTPGSPIQKEKELGITLTTAEIRARIAAADPALDRTTRYYLVPTDSSQRIGDNGSSVHPPVSDTNTISMDELFTTSFPVSGPASPTAARPSGLARASSGEANYFGIQARRFTAEECVAADAAGTQRWTTQPPFRFGVEFWDAEALPDKARLYSQTVWCGGSLFNAYVQVVRKKGATQLGIYLHRQSTIDVPGASAFRGDVQLQATTPQRERQGSLRQSSPPMTHVRGLSLPTNSPPTRSTTPVSVSPSSISSVSSLFSTSTATLPPAPPSAPYRDSRQHVSAYFTISCASATGASQTRFASAPDTFSVSQSWGWKSSSLRTEEYIDVGETAEVPATRGREISLRACVVLGLV
ncbi:BTB domain-containing protein [Mycena kentingensis (nom. inval.)]|nr:BTB domain-containing protein [Mycena kentingensis (nom. inval.)]